MTDSLTQLLADLPRAEPDPGRSCSRAIALSRRARAAAAPVGRASAGSSSVGASGHRPRRHLSRRDHPSGAGAVAGMSVDSDGSLVSRHLRHRTSIQDLTPSLPRRAELRRIGMVEQRPHEVRVHARAVVAVHAAELHRSSDRTSPSSRSRTPRTRQCPGNVLGTLPSMGRRNGRRLIAVHPRPLRQDEPVVLPRRSGEQALIGEVRQLGRRQQRRRGVRARR